MIQTLCTKLESEFDQFVDDIGPFLFHSLKETKTLKAGASTISDLCTIVESKKITGAFKEYIPLLFSHLDDASIEKEV